MDPAYIDGATARLRAWGFVVSEGRHARDVWGRFAGTDEDRLADLIEALNDPSVDVILCSRGGYGLQRIIDRVPAITKPIIGFSDITELHQLSIVNSQLSTVHGIMCKHIATLPEESEPIVALRKILNGEPIRYAWSSHPLNRFGHAEGPLVGGNLSVLYGLQGTPYGLNTIINYQLSIINYQKPLLLIEDIAERHYHIDRMMRNLRMSGVLANIGGLVVGQFSDCDDDPQMNQTVYETIKEVVADYDYPVLFDAPVGHVERNLPLWLNRHTSIDSSTNGALLLNGLDI
jgi:muramoyltetrapeptide carboxypeptidase